MRAAVWWRLRAGLNNEVGAIKGRFVEADAQWVKVETPKKGTQLINRNMIRNITFDNK